jgi:cardiolipin synthase (CMP-forming)
MGLTYLRLLLLPAFLWMLLLDGFGAERPYRYAALAVFAVMAVTDKLDGMLARRLGQVSRVGAVLDPIADKLLISVTVVLLWFERIAPAGYALPTWLVLSVYGKDLMLAVGVVSVLRRHGTVRIAPRWPGKWACALQMVTVVATLAAPDIARLGDSVAWWATRGLWAITAAVTLCAVVDYFLLGLKLMSQPRADGKGAAA